MPPGVYLSKFLFIPKWEWNQRLTKVNKPTWRITSFIELIYRNLGDGLWHLWTTIKTVRTWKFLKTLQDQELFRTLGSSKTTGCSKRLPPVNTYLCGLDISRRNCLGMGRGMYGSRSGALGKKGYADIIHTVLLARPFTLTQI